jgi:hypothetical protein
MAEIVMEDRLIRLQQRLAQFRPLGLAHVPTRLEPMARLARHLGGPSSNVRTARVLTSGGNKLRKLD